MKVPLFKIYWDEDDISSVTNVVRRGTYWCEGPEIQLFEKEIAKFVSAKHAVVFNSGGTALHAALLSLGIGPGDEVIVPSFTFIATAFAPLYVGATPVFADIELDTFALDPESVVRAITPRTKAIIVVHYGGIPAKSLEELLAIAEEHNLYLIEDAAEAFGAKYKGKSVGTFGHVGVYSFCQNKVITTGEGGAVVTDDSEIAERLRLARSYGRKVKGNYFAGAHTDYVSIGYNWRMSSISAALGLSQMAKVERVITARQEVAKKYADLLSDLDEVRVLLGPYPDSSVYQLLALWVKHGLSVRNSLADYLRNAGVATKVYFNPVHTERVFRGTGRGDAGRVSLRNTIIASEHVLNVPIYPHMTNEEVAYVAEKIKEFFSR